MTLQQTIAQTRLAADQHLRSAVADIGSALFTSNKEEIRNDWVKENYPNTSVLDIKVALALKGVYVQSYMHSFVIYPNEAIYKLLRY